MHLKAQLDVLGHWLGIDIGIGGGQLTTPDEDEQQEDVTHKEVTNGRPAKSDRPVDFRPGFQVE